MSLEKFKTDYLQVGMYVHKLGSTWIDHPFVRNGFLIKNDEDIRKIIESGMESVVIDTSRSIHPTRSPKISLEATSSISSSSAEDDYLAVNAPSPSKSLIESVKCTLERSLADVSQMFESARLGQLDSVSSAQILASSIYDLVSEHPHEVVSLARLKTKDNYTYMHCVAVSALMILLSRSLGLDEQVTREAALAGLMHDIGKTSLPDMILKKQGPLSPEEFSLVHRHPEVGANILKKSGAMSGSVIDACLLHHEKYNGTGYPKGLVADEAPLLARMAAVCDVYDAITSDRPYKRGWDPAYALHQMATWKGHFDPLIFHAFVRYMGVYPTGSLVRLKSERLAVVARQNSGLLLKPVVVAFYSLSDQCEIARIRLDLSDDNVDDAIVEREARENLGFSSKLIDSLWQNEKLSQI